MRSRSRSDVRKIVFGSKFAASSRISVVVFPDLGLFAAHDPRERDRARCVGDQQVVWLELTVDTVERAELLAGRGAAYDDPPLGELGVVERVQRVAEREHHVVRHVHDVRDRTHPRGEQPRLEPQRRWCDRDVAEEPADVARATLEVLDLDVDRLSALRCGSVPGAGDELQIEQRSDLAGDAVHGEQVGPVVLVSTSRTLSVRGSTSASGVPSSIPSCRSMMPV